MATFEQQIGTANNAPTFVGLLGNPEFIAQTGTTNPLDGIAVVSFSDPAFADIDGDGDLDIVVGEFDGVLNYFENTGSATAASFTLLTGSANPFNGIDVGSFSDPTFADIDGDGDLDVVVGDLEGNLAYFENTGSATAASFTQLTGSANPFNGIDVGSFSDPTFADIDGDGDLDVVVGEINGTLTYFENTGGANPASFVQLTGTANPFNGIDVGSQSSPTFADVDGDGDLDIVVGEFDGILNYFENTGTATEASFTQRVGTANPFNGIDVGLFSTPTFTDVDGDGDLDVVVGANDGTLTYFENQTPISLPIPNQSATEDAAFTYLFPANAFEDIDPGDSLTLSATLANGDPLPSWLTFDGTTFSGTPDNDDLGTLSIRVTATDLAGETASTTFDLEVSNTNDAPVVDAGIANQSATEDSAFTFIVPGDAFDDVDAGDSLTLDATLANGDPLPSWLTFDGTTFSGTPDNDDVGTLSILVTATDLAGETASTTFDLEVINTNDAPALAGLEFTAQTGTANPFNGIDVGLYSTPTLVDLDGDGDLDAVVGESDGNLNYFENTGTATEANFTRLAGTANPFNSINVGISSTPAFVDLDGDGDLDAVIGEFDGVLNYFENTGTATEANFIQRNGTTNPFNGIDVGRYSVPTLADVDGDGDLDAIIGEEDGLLNYFENTGTATAANFTVRTGTANPFNGIDVGKFSTPTLADLDGDGDLDAVIGEENGNLNYFENTGTATAASFTVRTGTANPFNGADVGYSSAPTFADVDGDGDLDAVVGAYSGTLDYLENTGPIPIPNQTAAEDAAFTYNFPADAFEDEDPGDSLTLSATLANGDPLPSWLTFDGTTFSGTPEDGDIGTLSIRVTATDLAGETASTTFDIIIGNTNDAPVVDAGIANQSATEDSAFTFIVPGDAFDDVDAGDSLTLDATLANGDPLPSWLTFDGTTFSGTPNNDDVGTLSILVTATDLAGETATTTFDLEVINTNDAPTLAAPEFTVRTGTANPLNGIDVGFRSTPTLADLDGDGDLDAVVGEGNGNLNYFENTGTATEATFTQRNGTANPFNGIDLGAGDSISPIAGYSSAPTLADLDGDGDLDAIIGEYDGTLNYFENTGTATEASFTQRNGTANPFNGIDVGYYSTPTFADLDGDGDLDAIVGEFYGTLNYFENTGTATEASFTLRTGNASPLNGIGVGFFRSPTLADADGDGDLDALIGEDDGTLTYFENTGSATEASFTQRTGTANPFNGIDVGLRGTPTFADLDGDGDLDAVVGEDTGTLNYIENTGPIPNQTAAEDAAFTYLFPAEVFEDVDPGDSLTLSATLANGDPLPSWLTFDGTTFSGTPEDGDIGTLSIRVTATDLAGETASTTFDIIIGNTNDAPVVDAGIANQSATEDSAFTFIVPGDAFDDVDAGDNLTLNATLANGDPLPSWLTFDGTTFSGTPDNEDVGTLSILVTATDLAGETASTTFDLEVINTNDAPTLAGLEFTVQTGTANPFNGIDVGSYSTPTFADLDGDGDLDAIIGEDNGNLNYFENTGTATEASFTLRNGTASPFNGIDVGLYSAPTFADLDGDGDLDAIIGEDNGTLNYFENTGTATEATFTQRNGTANPFDGIDVSGLSVPTLADVDGDGDLDAVVGEYDGVVSYFENTGTATEATFTERNGSDNPFDGIDVGRYSAPTLADLDGDGDLDAIVGKPNGTLDYFENTGTATEASFTQRNGTTNPFNGIGVDNYSTPALADLDGDGDLDAVVGKGLGTLDYLENTGPIPIPNQTAAEDAAFTYLFPADAFEDEDPGDSLTLSATLANGDPLPSWLTFDGTTFSGTPDNDDVGTVSILVTATDLAGETASTTFAIEVSNTNDAPIFVGLQGDPEFAEQTGSDNPFDGIDVGLYSAPTLVDLDGDGDLDAVVGDLYGTLTYFENTGSSFSVRVGTADPFNGITINGSSTPTFADVDGDGDLDAILGENTGILSYFENTGTATEASFTQRNGTANPFDGIDVGSLSDPTFADLDGDGDLDAVVGNIDGTLNYFENTGSATAASFTERTGAANPFDGIDVGGYSAPTLADVDGDGDLDAVVGELFGSLSYFENTGSATDATFTERTGAANPFDGIDVGSFSTPTVADVDGDGDLDAVVGELYGSLFYVENITPSTAIPNQTATEDEAFTYLFLADAFEDADPGDSLTLSATLANGDPLPSWLTFDGTTFSGTPDAGDVGTVSIRVTATDLAGETASTTFDITTESLAFIVTTTEDVVDTNDGVVSLREAIAAANATEGTDTITFDLPLDGGTIALSSRLTITDDLVINGPGVTITGGDFDLLVVKDSSLTVNTLALDGGSDGIDVSGTNAALTLTDVTITNSGDDGIELRNAEGALLSLTDVSIAAAGDEGIEAKRSDGATLTLIDSTISDSNDDNIDLDRSANVVFSLTNSTIANAGDEGIEISRSNDLSLQLIGGSITGSGDDGIDLENSVGLTLTADGTTFNNNQDGIYLKNTDGASVDLTTVTIVNSGDDGFEVKESEDAVITLTNSDISNSGDNNIDIANANNATLVLTDSLVDNAGDEGIKVRNSNGLTITISGGGIGGSGKDGIDIAKSSDILLTLSNAAELFNNADDNISLKEAPNATLVFTAASLNDAGDENVEVRNSDGLDIDVLAGTVITTANDDGIDVLGGSVNLLVSGGSVANNGNEDFNLSGATTAVVRIESTASNDTLIGSDVADVFVFSANGSSDTIVNFEAGTDRLDVSALGISTLGEMSFVGDTVQFNTPGGEQVSLTGVDVTTLTAADFQFDGVI